MIVRYLSSVDCETTSLLLGKTLVHDRIGLDASDEWHFLIVDNLMNKKFEKQLGFIYSYFNATISSRWRKNFRRHCEFILIVSARWEFLDARQIFSQWWCEGFRTTQVQSGMAMVQEEAMPPSPDPVTQTLDTNSGPPPSAEQVSQVTNRHMDTATYRDLVIFEERLRGNMRRLQRRKKKYEGMRKAYRHTNLWRECLYCIFLAILVLFVVLIAYFSYAVFIDPSSVRKILYHMSFLYFMNDRERV